MASYNFVSIALSVTCIKVLLLPSYRSTDFEVHRNWLAITYNLPISEWYTESTSQWTLDYPPLFAWFEYGLSQLASYFDPKMLVISAAPYVSAKTILFQRLSVIFTDIIYIYAAYQWLDILTSIKYLRTNRGDIWFNPNQLIAMLFLWNPGLLMVDHIHFQYNGFLNGVLLLSLARMVQKAELESAFWFCILLNLKHIYLYFAPAYFVYLLRNYCFDRHMHFKAVNFAKLSLTCAAVFAASFGPFVAMGQTGQVISRLFPFKRGLSHAYWAPNFWAIYNTVDKVMCFAQGKMTNASMTGGLVKESSHQILPPIFPLATFILVFASMIPALYLLWKRSHLYDSSILFVKCVVICAFSSFIFGWHVHEKAILMVILPLTPLALLSPPNANIFAIISTVGHFSLFPLLIKVAETPTKILLTLIYTVYSFAGLNKLHFEFGNIAKDVQSKLFSNYELLYMIGLIFVQFYSSCGNYLFGLSSKLPFLPLMLTSLYCAFGVLYAYVKFYYNTLYFTFNT